MRKRKSGPGFGMVLAFAVLLAAGFALLLYWRSNKSSFQNATPAETAAAQPEQRTETRTNEPSQASGESSARPENTQEVHLTPTSVLYYWPAADFVHFEFEVGEDESPVLDVDFNQNGRVDARLDRSYGLDTDGAFCAVYFQHSGGVSQCGAAGSVGSANVTAGANGGKTVAFVIPKRELSSDGATTRVTFGICHRGASSCDRFPAGSTGFAKSYMIPIR
jgi:hypothetical protein